MNEPKPTLKQQRLAEAVKALNALAGAALQQASNKLIGGVHDGNIEQDIWLAANCISFAKQLTQGPPVPQTPPQVPPSVKPRA